MCDSIIGFKLTMCESSCMRSVFPGLLYTGSSCPLASPSFVLGFDIDPHSDTDEAVLDGVCDLEIAGSFAVWTDVRSGGSGFPWILPTNSGSKGSLLWLAGLGGSTSHCGGVSECVLPCCGFFTFTGPVFNLPLTITIGSVAYLVGKPVSAPALLAVSGGDITLSSLSLPDGLHMASGFFTNKLGDFSTACSFLLTLSFITFALCWLTNFTAFAPKGRPSVVDERLLCDAVFPFAASVSPFFFFFFRVLAAYFFVGSGENQMGLVLFLGLRRTIGWLGIFVWVPNTW